MSFFNKIFGRGKDRDNDSLSMPWDERPSIYEHIRTHIVHDGPGLTGDGETLPDESRVNEGQEFRWAAGAMDGVASHHMGSGDDAQQIRKTVDLVLAYFKTPTVLNKANLYQYIVEGDTLPVIDGMIESLLENKQLNQERLYELAYSLVTESPDREPVKFGIAILGLYRQPENEALFQTLGRHEEFTLFCAVALANLSENPEQSLWTLARNVTGWGRIHVVERLAQTENPEIKNWLLREGYRNSIMYEYLAYTCATAGDLLSALRVDSVDRELLTSAGELLQALISGGPAEAIDSYQDGAPATEIFLNQMEIQAATLDDFLHVNTIKQFLDDDKSDWDARAKLGWTNKRRENLQATCDRILSRPQWAEQARSALQSTDDMEFYQANQAAEALGMDTWEHHWKRLQDQPEDSGCWYYVIVRCKDTQIADVVAFAEQHLDLSAIATGPGDELGLRPEFNLHSCLDYVLQELRRFPGFGEKLIQAGLQSPVVRNRNMALAALSTWGRERWSGSTESFLKRAAESETEEDVRLQIHKILNGEPLDD